MPQNNKELTEVIDKLAFEIDILNHQHKDYSKEIINIMTSLKEIGKGYNNDGCLDKIYHELQLLNKTIIMTALLISATKNPEKTLNQYNKIIEQYLN